MTIEKESGVGETKVSDIVFEKCKYHYKVYEDVSKRNIETLILRWLVLRREGNRLSLSKSLEKHMIEHILIEKQGVTHD